MLKKEFSEKIASLIERSIKRCALERHRASASPTVNVFLQPTKDKTFGDMTTNAARQAASYVGAPPVLFAEDVAKILNEEIRKSGVSDIVKKVEAVNGFINFYFSDAFRSSLLRSILTEGKDFGRSDRGRRVKVNVEYVSANPTGPLTIAHGRQAAVGDALSRILEFNGFRVTSEYYLNDFGRQINLLGKSVAARYRNLFGQSEPMPEDGYMGEYIIRIAEEIKKKKGMAFLTESPRTEKYFTEYAVESIMRTIKKDLADFRVRFGAWTSQKKLEEKGAVKKILAAFEKKGFIYEQDGAKWFASTRFGDDKDRVVVKNDGSYTYLAPDIAYHNDKFRRGFARLVDLFGPDHHGYVARMRAAVEALGRSADSLDVVIVQLATLMRNGQPVQMSTRRGEFITLREVLDEVGADVARFFFLTRKTASHLDFDIELAKKQSMDNPVYYVQYAHARICSIMKFSRKKGVAGFRKAGATGCSPLLLRHKTENELIMKLGEFPLVVAASADSLEPAKLVTYLIELAGSFHSFYTECRVVTDDKILTKARMCLVEAVRIVLANGLRLLNVTLPEKM